MNSNLKSFSWKASKHLFENIFCFENFLKFLFLFFLKAKHSSFWKDFVFYFKNWFKTLLNIFLFKIYFAKLFFFKKDFQFLLHSFFKFLSFTPSKLSQFLIYKTLLNSFLFQNFSNLFFFFFQNYYISFQKTLCLTHYIFSL